jgi:hypothetical protein
MIVTSRDIYETRGGRAMACAEQPTRTICLQTCDALWNGRRCTLTSSRGAIIGDGPAHRRCPSSFTSIKRNPADLQQPGLRFERWASLERLHYHQTARPTGLRLLCRGVRSPEFKDDLVGEVIREARAVHRIAQAPLELDRRDLNRPSSE